MRLFSEGTAVETSADEDHINVQAKSNETQEVDGGTINNGQSTVAAEAAEETVEETENVISSESEAPVSERAASGFGDSPTVGSPRVQFENIKEEDAPNAETPEAPTGEVIPNGHEEDRKCRRHQKHEHK